MLFSCKHFLHHRGPDSRSSLETSNLKRKASTFNSSAPSNDSVSSS